MFGVLSNDSAPIPQGLDASAWFNSHWQLVGVSRDTGYYQRNFG
jgi:hypothetical protein